ncbi:hypothetical protein COB55_05140 [Candidatus Wolfebacteria bacterium]|nr:MAG: hypothetical protein COB55_05140 [Candidatus Wolfebacteria bacterium]
MGFASGQTRSLKVNITEIMRQYLISDDKSGLVVSKFSFNDPDVNYLIAKGGTPPDITKNPVIDGVVGNILQENEIPDVTGISGPSVSGTSLSGISCTNTTQVREQRSFIRVKQKIDLSTPCTFENNKCGVHLQGFDMRSGPIPIKYSDKGGIIYGTTGTQGDTLGSGTFRVLDNLSSTSNGLMSVVIDIDTTIVVYSEKNFGGNVIFGPVTGPLFLVYTEGQTDVNNSIVLSRENRLDLIDSDSRTIMKNNFSRFKRVFYLNGNRVTSNVDSLQGNNISQPSILCNTTLLSGLESWCGGSMKVYYTPGEIPPHSKQVDPSSWDGNFIDEITQFTGLDPSSV